MRLQADDLLRLVFVADPRLSPTRDRAAFTVTRILPGDGDAPPRYRTRIHGVDLATRRSAPLTAGAGKDAHPRFGPDGALLAFLRAEDGAKPQLAILRLDGGEARRLTDRAAGVATFAWHPDGRRIACVSPACDAPPQRGGAPLRVTRTRHQAEGMGLLAEVPHDVVLVPAPASADAGGPNAEGAPEARVLAQIPFGTTQVAFSPDGAVLYALAATTDAEHAESRANLLALDPHTGASRPLLPRAMHIASFAVDDATGDLCFLAPADASAASAPAGLWHVASSGGAPQLVSGELEAAPSVAWDSRYGDLPATPVPVEGGWLCAVNASGRSWLAQLDPAGARRDLTAGDRAVSAFDGDARTLVFVAEAPDRPGELFLRTPDGTETRLTGLNDALVADAGFRSPSAPVRVARDGAEPEYWRLEPSAPREDGALVVQVHGGPAANYGYGFLFEFQLLAAHGYTVIYGNPRGGSSFGSAFATAIQGRYGTVDADDVMAMVEHAAAAHPVPGAPIHLTGGSYGGFMTNWLVGHTDRFRSAVTQRSICNFVSFYGTSDIGPWFTERELGGTPWSDLETLWRQSPLSRADRVRTPLLIVHAEDDRRCPIEQAEQLYAALRRLGRAPTELLRIPDEGHELSRSGRPDRRIARLEAILDWFARHA